MHSGTGEAPLIRHLVAITAMVAVALAFSVLSPLAFAQTVTVRVTVLEVKALTTFDGPDEADWFASVTIDGSEFDNEETPEVEDLEGNDHIVVSWAFTKDVDLSVGSVPVNIEIRDEDDFLKLADDLADINPEGGQASLDMTVALAPCMVSGDAAGPCRQSIISFSNGPEDGDGRAEIRFKIEVLNVPGVLAHCTHLPIWPQPGESVTLTVNALDGNLNSRTADTLEIVREDLPADTASAQASHSLTFTPAGDSFVYGCRATVGQEVVFSDWRRVLVGQPPPGERAIPVLFNEDKAGGIDILLVPDVDSYSGASDPQFLTHAAEMVYDLLGGLYSERVMLQRQHLLNIYLAMDTGDAEASSASGCPHVAPANFDPDYLFAEILAIVHSDVFRDCAKGGERLLSASPPSLANDIITKRVFVHELGHRPFGLADEYCNTRPGSKSASCDGGYFETSFLPNVFSDASACAADAADEGFGTLTCETWTDDDGNGPWSTYDPGANDLMLDNGDARFLDLRHINAILDECEEDGC